MNMSISGVWDQPLGGNLNYNFIYTVQMAVGMPPQYAQFAVDMHSPVTYVFA